MINVYSSQRQHMLWSRHNRPNRVRLERMVRPPPEPKVSPCLGRITPRSVFTFVPPRAAPYVTSWCLVRWPAPSGTHLPLSALLSSWWGGRSCVGVQILCPRAYRPHCGPRQHQRLLSGPDHARSVPSWPSPFVITVQVLLILEDMLSSRSGIRPSNQLFVTPPL